MPNVHPLVVHFPIALLTVSFLFDLVGLFARQSSFERVGWWTLVCGMAGLVLAVISGVLAEKSVVIPLEAASTFATHEQIAFLASSLYALLGLWRVGTRTLIPERRRWVYVGLSCLGMLLIWIGAWHGGELVYSYGVGVMVGR